MAVATLAELIVRIGADATGFDRAMGKVESKINKLGGRFQDIGGRLTAGISVPLAGLGGIALKSAIDFESAFAGVRKTVDATDEQLAALRQGIRDMAKEMPASAVEIAKVAEAAGQLGIKTENILEFTRVMVDLGVTTDLTADQAATAMARIANIMQTPQDEFDRLASTLVALGNAGASTESEIVEMALRIAGAGKQVGMTEAQVLSFASALSSVGINAEAGGSAISRAMIAIENAVQGGGEKLRLFAQVAGMSVADFKRAWEQDAAGALVTFIEGLGKLGKEGENVFPILDRLGLSEIQVRDALLRAAGAGDLFRESLQVGTQAWQDNIALTEEAEKRYDTTESKLQILKNRLNDIAITLGEQLTPAIEDFLVAAQPLMDFITRLAQWFANLSPETQKWIVTLLGITIAMGPVLSVIGVFTKALGGIVGVARLVIGAQGLGGLLNFGGRLLEAFALWRGGAATFMEALGLIVSPAAIWIAAIAAIIAIGILLWKNWDEIKAWLLNTWATIKAKALEIWGGLKTWLQTTWDNIKTQALTVWENIKASVLQKWEAIKSKALEIWNTVKTLIETRVQGIRDRVTSAFETLKQKVLGAWDGLKEGIRGTVNRIIDFINGLIRALNRISINVPDWVPVIGGLSWSLNIPEIPKLAKGGIVTRPTLALIGEAGPEAVIPLDKLRDRQGPAPVHISGPIHITVQADDLRDVEAVLNLFRNLRQAARAGV